MSMAHVLAAVKDTLRNAAEVHGLRSGGIGIEPDGDPPQTASGHYIAIDEGNIESTEGVEQGLREFINLSVYVMREANPVAPHQLGAMLEAEDRFLANILTLEKLERITVKALHNNWEIPTTANDNAGLPSGDLLGGDIYQSPLMYQGRGRMDTLIPESATGQEPQHGWRRRELRFRGMLRIQAIDIVE